MGPRPALPNEVATYNDYQRQRLLVKPGMTCYWQTRRNRDSITLDEWVDLDLWRGGRNSVSEIIQKLMQPSMARVASFQSRLDLFCLHQLSQGYSVPSMVLREFSQPSA